jgi:hypothetical protein
MMLKAKCIAKDGTYLKRCKERVEHVLLEVVMQFTDSLLWRV